MKKAAAILMIMILSLTTTAFAKPHHKKPQPQLQEVFPDPKTEVHGNVLVVNEDFGGYVSDYMVRYAIMQKDHIKMAINGECDSSCTLFLGYIPREDVCVTDKAKIGFHRANRPEGTMLMMMMYPRPVLMWLMAEGMWKDIHYMPEKLMFGLFQKCPDALLNPPPRPQGEEKVD